jgi:hypothetical protein
MSRSWTRVLGLSMVACLLAILAAPALAAGPAHYGPSFPAPRGRGMTGLAGRGMNLFTTLQVAGLPVIGPLAVLMPVERAVESLILPSSRENPLAFAGNRSRMAAWSGNRTTIPLSRVGRGVSGTMEMGFAANLTAYLGGKGYDVADLNAALTDARTALAGSNLTAFRRAMMSFMEDLNAKISAGTVNRTVIQDYLETLPVVHQAPAGRYVRVRMMRSAWRSRW